MKIKTDFSNNFFTIYDEARGISKNKKAILKNKDITSFSYMQGKVVFFLIMFILGSFVTLLSFFKIYLVELAIVFLLIGLLNLIYGFVRTLYSYFYYKKKSFVNEIIFDKDGVVDESFHDIIIRFKWDKILGIVIANYSIVFVTDTPIYFWFNINDKNKILKVLKKYKQDKKIMQ